MQKVEEIALKLRCVSIDLDSIQYIFKLYSIQLGLLKPLLFESWIFPDSISRNYPLACTILL